MNRARLDSALQQLAAKATLEIRAAKASAATFKYGPQALVLLWLLPSFGIMLIALTSTHLSLATMLALMIVAPLLALAIRAAAAFMEPCSTAQALAVADEHLHLKGRPQTTQELLPKSVLSSFEIAALEDSQAPLQNAAESNWQLDRSTWQPGEKHAPHLIAALLLLAVYALLIPTAQHQAPPPGALDNQVAALDTEHDSGTAQTRPEPPGLTIEPIAPTPPKAQPIAKPNPKAEPKEKGVSEKLPDEMQSSLGKTGQGKSSDAQSQSSASESRGAPSGQTPAPPKEGSKPSTAKKKPKQKKPGDDQRQEPKEENDPGGSTAGRGSAKGSNRNTTTSKWSSKDQVTTPDDQEIEDDEDTEDEDEEQENRGGMQPNLRDRRPPASRDLRIGFGNRPSPDANGRGGPSEAKKSRGTASLVLGVPIPDRIKGQPNAGPTRITQERIEPSAENEPAQTAEARQKRAAALGQLRRAQPLEHPRQLSPWQRNLIRAYLVAPSRNEP